MRTTIWFSYAHYDFFKCSIISLVTLHVPQRLTPYVLRKLVQKEHFVVVFRSMTSIPAMIKSTAKNIKNIQPQ